ncbi:MAG TPA: DUF1553 domain-containing protein [Thermoguttaceae bacterium]|nr:DUF1553 domain-containing protein [Thermoguttaceae bacterium]
MVHDLKETRDDGIPLDLGQSPPRYAQYKRKKSAWVVWLQIGAIPGVVLAVAGAVGWLVLQDSSSLTILPMPDQEIAQGDELRMQIPIRRAGYERGQLTYSLSGAPPGATFDEKTGVFSWTTTKAHEPGTYEMIVKVLAAGPRPRSDERTFTVRLRGSTTGQRATPSDDDSGLSFDDAFNKRFDHSNPFEVKGDVTPQGKIDELVFAKLKELKIEPANLCSDAVFLRRAYLDAIGTLPTIDEAEKFLEDKNPDKRAALIDRLLERPEFADYWAMKWSDLLRVKAEFPINLWPNAAQAYHRWIRASLEENMPYDRFVRELLTACGSNFRTPQVNFYRALQSKEPEAIAQAVALVFMGVRAEKWPQERLEGMAVFFSQVGFKPTREWKEEIVVFDPHKGEPAADAPPPKPVFPDGTACELPPGQDPREVFADWLIDAKNPWFTRHIVNRVWYWLLGRGIVHEPDDIRPDNPTQNLELLNWLAEELVRADYDLKHVYRLILNSTTYQLSCIPKSKGPEAAENFACYSLRRLDAEVLVDALCQITGTTEFYSSMIPEPFTFVPERQRSIVLPDGSITSSVLEMLGRPPRDTGLESERNNRFTAAQALHLLNSTHVLQKIRTGPKIQELLKSTDSSEMPETLYLTILSRLPTDAEKGEISWQCDSQSGAEDLVWALVNSEEFLFRH